MFLLLAGNIGERKVFIWQAIVKAILILKEGFFI
jgi:hypothetical protein